MIIVRLFLFCMLVYFVYEETGPWTAATIALILVNHEAFIFWIDIVSKGLKKEHYQLQALDNRFEQHKKDT